MWRCRDNQDVGSEAATIQRVRNSSLVKWLCAENVTGLKPGTEAAELVESLSVLPPPRPYFHRKSSLKSDKRFAIKWPPGASSPRGQSPQGLQA